MWTCFNYSSIYNEIIKQKTIKNYKEVQKLHKDSIKCPYCRTIQDKLLPYNPQFKKIKLVNCHQVKVWKVPTLKIIAHINSKVESEKGCYAISNVMMNTVENI